MPHVATARRLSCCLAATVTDGRRCTCGDTPTVVEDLPREVQALVVLALRASPEERDALLAFAGALVTPPVSA